MAPGPAPRRVKDICRQVSLSLSDYGHKCRIGRSRRFPASNLGSPSLLVDISTYCSVNLLSTAAGVRTHPPAPAPRFLRVLRDPRSQKARGSRGSPAVELPASHRIGPRSRSETRGKGLFAGSTQRCRLGPLCHHFDSGPAAASVTRAPGSVVRLKDSP
jgi:hypothetical protein